ncbi:MAG: LysM peptidoglycan-binding domain-containing protein [Elusimicrobia bacterium]|jgi:hypothetical protein|nr:LysM peptidoglycan-binding domain-containing protein [Elusimicrobiota bacterium]
MMRASFLALLLAVTPLVWAEETVEEWDDFSETETADVLSAGAIEPSGGSSTVVPVDAVPPAGSSTTVKAVVPVPGAGTHVTPVVSPPSPEPDSAGLTFHRVVKGDTLWDLAGSYLNNAFLWPKIFEANKKIIKDPHWIYPDQEFLIPSVVAAAKMDLPPAPSSVEEAMDYVEEVVPEEVVGASEPEVVTVPVVTEEAGGAVEPSAPVAVDTLVDEGFQEDGAFAKDEREAIKKRSQAVPGAGFMGGVADTFLADENWEYDGYVLRDRDQRMMISQGDVVYLNIGAAAGVKEKMMAHVYRVGKKVRDPYLKKKTVRMIKRVGTVMVTGQVNEEGCTAVVTNSLEPIRVGDIVKFVAR